MKILILYSSIDGHTKNICSFISSKLKQDHTIQLNEINNEEDFKFYLYDFMHWLDGNAGKYAFVFHRYDD